MTRDGFHIPAERLTAICRQWRVTELALFGSVLRDDFGPESDVDILVTFDPHAGWSLWDLFDLQDELQAVLGRPVDLVEKKALRNPFRRREILNTCRVLLVA